MSGSGRGKESERAEGKGESRRASSLGPGNRSGRSSSGSTRGAAWAGEETKVARIRDPVVDHLLTPANCALLVIDFQPQEVDSVASMDKRALVANIVAVAETAVLFGLPVVLSTVNVVARGAAPTIPQLAKTLEGVEAIDRTTINAWEDPRVVRAVKATGRRKLVVAALWTEACLTFPTLDALRAGYEVYIVVDAVGGTSLEAHRAAIERMVQAGAKPIGWVQLACELQRNWDRVETADAVAKLLFAAVGK